ncbi:MAG: PEP/pyruvate-binding domain-containing protein [Planctomycetota bacterium]
MRTAGDAVELVDLKSLDPAAVERFGGKACGLARLIGAGLRVPGGFAVEATGCAPERWPAALREAFRERVEELLEAGPVVVRSSAPREDSESRSFAGLFETTLGVAGAEEALDAAARCIASAEGERVRAYAEGDPPSAVGVVTQTQVNARSAGVCFTVDPAGRDGALVIEAVAGLGEALVAGKVEPERWRVYRAGTGRWEAQGDGAGAGEGVLSSGEVIGIARLAADHAAGRGRPLDLEWAIDPDGELWWLQARPITAAAPCRGVLIERAFEGVDDGPITVWGNFNVRETLPDPLPPLSWCIWREVLLPGMTTEIFGCSPASAAHDHVGLLDGINGRIYWNLNMLMAAIPFSRRFLPLMMGSLDEVSAEVTKNLIRRGILRRRRIPRGRALLRLRAFPREIGALLAILRPRRTRRRLELVRERFGDPSWKAREESEEELLKIFEGPIEDVSMPFNELLGVTGFAGGVYELCRVLFRHHPDAVRLLVAGLPGNPTTEISSGIGRLTAAARPLASIFLEPLSAAELLERLQGEPRAASWRAAFDRFLGEVGHRCPGEMELSMPRWSEDPTMLIDLIRAGLRSPEDADAEERQQHLAGKRAQALAAAVAAAPFWKRPFLRWLLRQLERYMPLREAPKHFLMVLFQRIRQSALELGRRLVIRGLLDEPADVFFLELDEIAGEVARPGAAGDLRARVAERRAAREALRRAEAPEFVRSDGVPVLAPRRSDAGDGVLWGTPVSGGAATGAVRILLAPDPTAMTDGDVIVMKLADPCWTPLFPRAGAVVMEIGGLMCHAAVVVRELGIPAVFGLRDATRRLADGQRVTVDGARGTVTEAAPVKE